jgi:hypothetical protein
MLAAKGAGNAGREFLMQIKLMGIVAAGLMLAFVPAAPALAADVATLPCVRQQLDSQTLDEIRSSAERSARGEMGIRPSEENRAALMKAAGHCGAKYGWTEDEAQYAGLYTLAELRLAAMEPVAKEKGVDLAKIRVAVGNMSEDEKAMIRQGERGGSEALIRGLSEIGVEVPADFAVAQLYGRLATILLVLDDFRSKFAGQ